MEKKHVSTRFMIVVIAISLAVLMRLVPHWPNFTPVAAIALFSGATIHRKSLAFLIPVFAMLLSDIVLGFHATMLAVYAGFLITVLIGFRLRNRVKAGNVVLASLSSSVIFFLITNFGAWISGMMPYSKDFSGLMQAYIAGIPFFNNGLLGDLFYSTVLFGAFYLVTRRYPALAK
ncbi:MAG TPA: hypothetical protein PLV51_13205 [Lentimicrobium sp.]|jgi:hypothetical protein|nr:hypothetical protein [Lentimicrobium sp.]